MHRSTCCSPIEPRRARRSRSTPASCSPRRSTTWRAFEERWGVKVEVFDARREARGRARALLRRRARSAALERALTGVDALGHRPAPRAGARPARRRAARVGRAPRHLEVQPAGGLDRQGRLALHRRARPALQPAARPRLRLDRLRALHTARGAAARAAGPARTRPSAACTCRAARGAPREPRTGTATSLRAPTCATWRPRRSTSCARSPPSSSGPCCCSRGGKDSIVLLRLAEKAFRPGALPVPDHARGHGTQLPRGHRVPRPPRGRAGRAPDRGLRPGLDRRRARGRGDRPARLAQPPPDDDPAGRHRGARLRRRLRRARAATRSAPGRRSACSRFRDDFGQWDPKAQRPELWKLYNGRVRRGEHVRVFPISNWTELDVWQYIAEEEPGGPVDLLRPRARGVHAATGCSTRTRRFVELMEARSRSARRCATAPWAT